MIEMIMNGTQSEQNNPYIGIPRASSKAKDLPKVQKSRTMGLNKTNSTNQIKEGSIDSQQRDPSPQKTLFNIRKMKLNLQR